MTASRRGSTPAPGVPPVAEERVIRVIAAFGGAIGLCVLAGEATVVVQPRAIALPGWYQAAVLAVYGLLVVIGVLSVRARLRLLRWMNAGFVAAYFTLLGVLGLAIVPFSGPVSGQLNWMLTTMLLPTAAAAIAWGRVAGWVTLGVIAVVVRLLRLAVGDFSQNGVVNDLQMFTSALILCVLIGELRDSARERDRASALAGASAERRAAELARHDARVRAQTLIHDEVMATLAFAGRATAAMVVPLAEQAARARIQLAELARGSEQSRPVEAAELGRRAVQLLDGLDSRASLEIDTSAAIAVPAEAVSALLGAMHQAVVNSIAHAGQGARRIVSVVTTPHGVAITVADDGRGFDAAKVPTSRLGIAMSIVGRMRTVIGGDASVTSRPGAGTTVALRWSPQEGPRAAARPDAGASSLWGRSPAAPRVLVGVFVVSQVALAVYLAVSSPRPWLPLTAAAGILMALAVLGWADMDRLRRGTAIAATTVVVATAFLSFAPATEAAFQFADTWYVAGGGLLLALVALRGRPVVAIVGLAFLLAVFLAGVATHGAANVQLPAAIARPTVTVLAACLLGWGVSAMRRRTIRLRAEELAAREAESWAAAMSVELRRHSVDLARRVGPMIARVEEGRPLDAGEAGECLALEGMLRDELRGGRLARDPLAAAAADARRRGVDVALVDDVSDRAIPEPVLDELAVWLSARLDGVDSGTFVGRILPRDAGPVAVAVTDGQTTSFGG